MVYFRCFGLKTGMNFDNYGLKSGLVFKETTRAAQYSDKIRLKFLLETMFGVIYY